MAEERVSVAKKLEEIQISCRLLMFYFFALVRHWDTVMKESTQGHAKGNIKDSIVGNVKILESMLSNKWLVAIIQRDYNRLIIYF